MSRSEEFCSGCPGHRSCSEVYRKLGFVEGASVLPVVFAAFLVPMLVFILSASFLWSVFSKVVESNGFLTVVVLLPASFFTFLSILLGRKLISKSAKRKE